MKVWYYDISRIESRFVTVYDFSQARVILLDRQTQVQTTVGTSELVKVTAQVRAAAKTPQQQERLGLTARVQPSNRLIGYSIRFGNCERHTTTQIPNDPTIAADYGQFADLALRLNLLRPPGPSPFGPMTLNDYITRKGEVPLETTLSLRSGETVTEYRSTHILGELTDADQKQIAEISGMLALYREVNPKRVPKSRVAGIHRLLLLLF